MSKFSMDMVVDPKLGKSFDGLSEQAHDGAARGLMLGGEHVLDVSNAMVPHETGTLERTGAVSQDETGLLVAVSYDTEYAAEQHENVELKHDAGRQAKFLQQAMEQEREKVMALVQGQVRRALGTD